MKSLLMFLAVFVLASTSITAVQAGAKVKVCHIPPGNPDNFHTITISDKALPAHLAHGDLPGDCADLGEYFCDDGDACTIDVFDPATGECMVDHPPVNCDDGLACTTESCDSIDGCQSAPIVCDDGDLCTVDACSEPDGQCTETPKDCGLLGLCLQETGECDFPCEGITCEPIDQCHEPGRCVLPGECEDGVPVEDGTPCDDGDANTTDDQCTGGSCGGTVVAACPCFSYEDVVEAVEGMNNNLNPGRTECNKAVDLFPDGSIIFSERYIYFDWPEPDSVGTAVHAVVSNDRIHCNLWVAHPWPAVETPADGGWDRMLSCIAIMEEAVEKNATPAVLEYCDW